MGGDMAIRFERPEIDFLILADRAEAVNGKLYMMGGGWDRLTILDFAQPVGINLAIGVLVPWNDTNEPLPLTIWIEDQDFNKITPELTAMVSVGRPPNAVKGQTFRAIIAVQNAWKLPGPGTYLVKVTVPEGKRIAKFYALTPDGTQSLPPPQES